MKVLGHLGNGSTFDTIEYSGRLYALQGTEVRIYDVSTNAIISNLTWRSYKKKIDVGYFGEIIKVYNNDLYILTAKEMKIFSLTDPDNPSLLGTYQHQGRVTRHRGLSFKDNYAYISSYEIGIIVVNISNKSLPSHVRTLSLGVALSETNRPTRSTISGNYLYVGTEVLGGRMFVINITNPAFPVRVGEHASTMDRASISAVAVSGNYMYAVDYINGFWVIDITNPANMTVANSGFVGEQKLKYNDVKILGTKAYFSVRYGGYDTYDISSPSQPVMIASIEPAVPGYSEGIYITPDEKRVYISVDTMGFFIYDNSTAASPKELAHVVVLGAVDSVAVDGTLLVAGGRNEGVWLIDNSNPYLPKEDEFMFDSGRHPELVIDTIGGRKKLFLAGEWSQFSIIDIDSKSFDTYRFGTNTSSVLVDNSKTYAYLTHNPDTNLYKFSRYKISNTKAVTIENQVELGFTGKCVQYNDRYLLACGTFGHLGLHVIDLTTLQIVKTFLDGTKVDDIALDGKVAYIAAVYDIYSINVTDILNPVRLHNLSFAGTWYAHSLTMDRTRKEVYIGGTQLGEGVVKRVDVSNPSAMRMMDEVTIADAAVDVFFSGGIIYAAAYKAGLYAISPENIMTPTGIISVKTTPVNGDIYVDGVLAGNGSVSKTIDVGIHEVTFGTVQYYDTPGTQQVEVKQDQTTYVEGKYTGGPVFEPSLDQYAQAAFAGAIALYLASYVYQNYSKSQQRS